MRLSIIIPTLNRAKLLDKTLESIEKQYSKIDGVEVIVIDNGSTDLTKEVCLDYEGSINNFKYVYDDEPGLLTGRHRGAEIATGEILCFLDDDVELNPNYIKGIISLFKNKQVQIATGPCLPNYEIEPPEWLTYFWDETPEGKYCAWLSLLDFGNKIKEINAGFVWGLNFCIRKQTLIDLGGFHPDCIPNELQQYQGDGESGLISKATSNGIIAYYSPELTLKHDVPKARLTVDYFKKRAYYQGVCNSFSNLRSQPYQIDPPKKILKKLRNKLHPYYRWVKTIYKPEKVNNTPTYIKEIMEDLTKSELEGYNFHQHHFNNDKRVEEWVLKENYWDFKLPI